MQLLFLLSALLAALSGVGGGRDAAPQQIVTASALAVTAANPAAPTAIVVLGVLFTLVSRILPLPRPFALGPAVALYRGRRRE